MSKNLDENKPIEFKPLLSQLKCSCNKFQVDSYNRNKLNPKDYNCPYKNEYNCKLIETHKTEVNKQDEK